MKVLTPKKKEYPLERYIKETQKRLRLLWNELTSISQNADEIENIEKREKKDPKIKHFKEYEEWIAKEFKIEEKIKKAVREMRNFEIELSKIEDSLEKNIERELFESYPKLKHEYNKKLKKEIKKLKCINDEFVRDMLDAQKEIPNEKRYEKKFPEIADEIRLKNGYLYVQATKLHSAVTEIRMILGHIEKQEKLTR